MIKTLFLLLVLTNFSLALVELWGQCDGINYTGEKKCAAGLVCVYFDVWYSQCQKPSGTSNSTQTTSPTPEVTLPPLPAGPSSTFSVKGNKVYDANGNEFLIRGVNSAHADWDNWSRSWALKSLSKIAEYKANTVRVQWRMQISNNDLDLKHLENIITTAARNGLVSMVQLHDATGSNDPNMLKKCAQWFADNMALFVKHQKYVMINIANEWSEFGTGGDVWKNAYITAINIVRSSGWRGVIVIDAPAYAQDPIAVIHYGPDILNHDKTVNKNGNILFSLHTYVQWRKSNPDYRFRFHLIEILNAGLALVIGEFADQHPEHPSCRWVDIDYEELMTVCKEKSIGYLGWSWAGNGYDCNQDLSPLNLVSGNQQLESTWTQGVLSRWGERLFTTPLVGIQATSKKATIF